MGKAQFLKTAAGEIAILPRADYDELVRLAKRAERNEHKEDAGTRRIVRRTRKRLVRGEDVLIPKEVVDRIEAGESPILAVREWREILQRDLAAALEIGQGYLSDIEHRRRRGPADLLAKIARELKVPVDLLID